MTTIVRYLKSNLLACLALFVALGGASYAAVALPKNSVGAKQIKANAVTGTKVKNGSLQAADFAAGQLPTGAKGDPGATGLTGAKGDTGTTGATGAKGDKGDKGDTGDRGPSNLYSTSGLSGEVTLVNDGTENVVGTLTLPAGKYMVTGKAVVNNNDNTAANDARVTCRIRSNGVTLDEASVGVQDNNTNQDIQTAALTTAINLPTELAVDLVCVKPAGITVGVGRRQLLAIAVSAIN